MELTTQTTPKGATHWSTRTLAAELGVSAARVSRLGVPTDSSRTWSSFKVSRDPKFVEKLEDIVGLYMSPPEHALVLCCDEKSQVQALDRTQPGLPLKKGRAATLTHDYKRNGTTTLFAALSTLDGSVIALCPTPPPHRVAGVLAPDQPRNAQGQRPPSHLRQLRHPQASHVQAWLEKHPRFHVHFTPTSASWLNMVERFFRSLTTERLQRGVFRSVPELIAAIEQYIATHNQNPKPFVWTAKANDILQKVIRANRRSVPNRTKHYTSVVLHSCKNVYSSSRSNAV